MTDRDQATLPEFDEESDDTAFDSGERVAANQPAPVDPANHNGVVGPAEPDPSPDADPDPATLEWAEATAAYVLGVLSPEDAAAAGQEIARSRALQAEVAALLPVADILLSLYQTQPAPVASAATTPAPPVERARSEPAPARAVPRPRREPGPRPAIPGLGTVTPSTILVGVLALAAAIGLLWALALSDRIATRDDEIAALKRQVGQLRQAANASVFVLSPTDEAPEGARGTVFYSLADAKVLIDVSGLPELDEDRVYQVWFQRNGSDAWEPGPTFLVNQQGESVQRLPGETPTFTRIAISEEPAPGSREPSEPLLLQGSLSGGNG